MDGLTHTKQLLNLFCIQVYIHALLLLFFLSLYVLSSFVICLFFDKGETLIVIAVNK